MAKEQRAPKLLDGENVLVLLIAVFSLFIQIESGGYPEEARRFPEIVSGLALVLCVIQLIKKVVKYTRFKAESRAAGRQATEVKEAPKQTAWAWVALVVVIYYFIIEPVGVLISTIAVGIVIPYILGYKKPKIVIPVVVGVTLAIYLVFKLIFYVPLPAGILGF